MLIENNSHVVKTLDNFKKLLKYLNIIALLTPSEARPIGPRTSSHLIRSLRHRR